MWGENAIPGLSHPAIVADSGERTAAAAVFPAKILLGSSARAGIWLDNGHVCFHL